MPMPIIYHSKICEIAHGAMANLFAAGLIDADCMMEFDRRCVSDQPAPEADVISVPLAVPMAVPPQAAAPQPQPLRAEKAPPVAQAPEAPQTAAALRALREREGVNVAVFAHHLDVQPQAVLAWEAGFLRPTAAVARLLEVIAEKGLSAIQ